MGWPFSVLKCKYVSQIKYTETILSNSTGKLLWFEITKMLIAFKKNKFIVLFIIISGTLSFSISSKFRDLSTLYSSDISVAEARVVCTRCDRCSGRSTQPVAPMIAATIALCKHPVKHTLK